MKINCVIVDDESENLKYLQQIIEDIDNVEVIKSFTDGESFVEEAKTIKFDICVLDNRLPNMSGLECAKQLRGKKIIFMSAHEVSAHDAFDVKAIDVLKKPVIKDRLENAIRKARNIILNEKGLVFIKTNSHGRMRFKLEDIIYITTDKDNSKYKTIICTDGDEVKTQKCTLEDLMDRLPSDRFCIVNKFEILNTIYFKSFVDQDTISVHKAKKKLIIGEKFLDGLKKTLGDETE